MFLTTTDVVTDRQGDEDEAEGQIRTKHECCHLSFQVQTILIRSWPNLSIYAGRQDFKKTTESLRVRGFLPSGLTVNLKELSSS